ncbi:lytic transglycosylase domain-containing protein [Pelobium sp.]|nr:lytic transglycosylase domain-containing protein [Pelobium sp.]MDA9555583.1 lytic transglycosylase domain-containing protein [Pelobium sp.]
MIKKYVVACSLMLIICVLTKMFGYSYSTSFSKVISPDIESARRLSESIFYKDLNFANEQLPIGDKKVEYRMIKALKAKSFSTLQTLKLHQKAEVWFPIIEPVLKKYGIPEDFKYIPLIESGLTRHQFSPKGAAGLWQLMPETGRDYGLKVNDEVDERLNPRLATVAAAKYLRSLYKQFNSWTLVAAAYNGGEGRIRRVINNQNQDDYFKMDLNSETGKYVYGLISMKEVIEHPEDYGYKIKNPRKLLAYQN